MLKRLIVLALALAGGWIVYRRVIAPPAPGAAFDTPFTPAPTARPPAASIPAEPPAAPASIPAEPPAPENDRTGVLHTPDHAPDHAPDSEQIEAYCMRCKEHRPIQDMRIATTADGRRAAKGTCPVCGAKLNRFLPSLEG